MRGKPIAEISLADLKGLIEDAVPEGQHLEYKNQIPSRDGKTTGGWTPGKGVDSAGRDKLLEELVAFANADGGVIVDIASREVRWTRSPAGWTMA